MGLSLADAKEVTNQKQILGRDLIEKLCTEVCGDLDKIGLNLQDELLTGIAEVVDGIRASYDLGAVESDVLDSMASTVRHLAQQVTALFEAQPYVLRRHQFVYQADIEEEEDQENALRVTVEEFMQNVKPPERRPTLRDRLQPYIPELKRLRQEGYTYAQCVHFLGENGINTYVGAISSVLSEVS
ncbi:hypothetical protein QN391_16240 [Pseudomonas sp. CCI1.2]|uniref:hypothetical protein n=1 Tax=Pseudomonas sp. CCI1.2 TaxID=3048614 RepID=UPI002B22A4B4|nr:hypothetical protein [Pseudomonas sp. CCI1.2]MEB0122235.1 hypothetical protein [Pseudomonas sp. CCI1.2]